MQDATPTEKEQPPSTIDANSETPQTDIATGATSSTPVIGEVGKSRSKLKVTKKQLILVACILVLLGGVAAYFVIKSHSKKPAMATVTPAPQESTTPITPVATNQYLASPKKLSSLNFFLKYDDLGGQDCDANGNNCKSAVSSKDVTYYQVGTTKDDQKIIVVHVITHDIDETRNYIALQTSSTAYKVLLKNSSPYANAKIAQSDIDKFAKDLNKGITADASTSLSELTFAKAVNVEGQDLTTDYLSVDFLINGLRSLSTAYSANAQTPTKLAEKDGVTYYRRVVETDTDYQVVQIIATYKDLFAQSYDLKTELLVPETKFPTLKWSKGEDTKVAFYSHSNGCGTGFAIDTNVPESKLVQVGTTPAGAKLYQLPTTDPLVTNIFTKAYAKGAATNDNNLKNLTIQQFTDKHGYFLTKNALGDWMLFERSDIFQFGGCGKPVVYLYPTETTSVDVKVSADVVVSDPLYPADGWQNVIAHPDGSLDYQGKSYDSLLWEGYGHGLYPQVVSGSVVATSRAITTIRSQLSAQGLNTKEINDFVEYWGPKLPHTLYTRLTWFNTAEVNSLAPLTISPRPDTLIRVFLDFDGLNKPVKLTPQQLHYTRRQGFTVVEWGGLLRQGIKH